MMQQLVELNACLVIYATSFLANRLISFVNVLLMTSQKSYRYRAISNLRQRSHARLQHF